MMKDFSIPKKTLTDVFLRAVTKFNKKEHFLVKKDGKYTPISTEEFKSDVIRLALGLKQMGIKRGDKVNILAETSYNWLVSDLAILSVGAITVPIYPTLPADQAEYIINDSESVAIFFSTPAQWEKIKTIKEKIPNVKHFITFTEKELSSDMHTLEGVRLMGDELSEEDYMDMVSSNDSEDIATIIYTSGTTGVPKGVMLTHFNIFSNVYTVDKILPIGPDDRALSFLPLSHVLERMVTYVYLYVGATIAYAESIEKVARNIVETAPTIVVSVPRLFERIYTKIIEKASKGKGLKKKLFFWALGVGEEKTRLDMERKPLPQSLKWKYKLADKLVFSKIKSAVGGRIRFFISGGAALPKKVGEFFYAINMPILEGYGLTETSPVICVNTFDNFKIGTVGKPMPKIEVKIDEDGEILTRGPHVMKGYFKKEKETKEVLSEDGWFRTGDIGFLDEEGFLSITDRKKDIIVTSGGKNVAPQPIEGRIKQSPYVLNAVVIGNERKYLSALIVPDFDKMEDVSRAIGKKFQNESEFIKDKDVEKFFLKEVKRMVPDLADFEVIKRVALLERDFSIDEGEITPTLKIRRSVIEKKYKKIIDRLYR